MAAQKTSSSIKVGILTLVSIFILIVTVLWIKGRSLSAGERIEVIFRDVNGIRAGSGVQMMGLRVGQIEEITPVMEGVNSYVKVKFVITEKGIDIPKLSTVSIQQSGLIGEQFLEITPPKIQTVYLETAKNSTVLTRGSKIYMDFRGGLEEIGEVIRPEIISSKLLARQMRDEISTSYALRVDYIITLPGLILPSDSFKGKFTNGKFIFYTINGENVVYPLKTASPYTVVEPMRMSEFMDLQFRAARSLKETNERITQLLSDDLIYELQESAKNINELTNKAITTLDKAEVLVENSKTDLDAIFKSTNKLVSSLTKLTDNVNSLVGDTEFKSTILDTAKSVGRLSDNLNTVLEDPQSKEILKNLDEISKNLADITLYVNEFTKDEKLKKDLKQTVSGINRLMENVNTTLKDMNELPDCEKVKLSGVVADVVVTTRNLKMFSQKLNKRFLLFRLMF